MFAVDHAMGGPRKPGGGFFFPEMTPQGERIHYFLTVAGEVTSGITGKRVPIKGVTSYFREFLVLFFGASWSKQSIAITEELMKYLKHANGKAGKPAVEVVYIGNEQSESELKDYI